MKIGTVFWIGFIGFVAYGTYQLFFVGSPENVKFRKDCLDREERQMRRIAPGLTANGIDDALAELIATKCERELRIHLGLKP